MAKKPEKKEMVAVATELNGILKPDPPIDTKATAVKLMGMIKKGASLLEKGDNISKDTAEFFTTQKIEFKATVKVPKKEAPAKKEAPTKKKTPKKEAPAKKKDKGPSNKEVVWKLWKNGKGMTDPEKLHKKVNEAVKLTTIKQWLKKWAEGDPNWLPACAKKK